MDVTLQLVIHVSEVRREKTTPQFLVYTLKKSKMVGGQIIPLFLLTILHGGCCGFIEVSCSEEHCQCGENVTVTCNVTHPPEDISLQYGDETSEYVNLAEKDGRSESGTIEWTKDTVKVTISKVKFSDTTKYALILGEGSKGILTESIKIHVSGICEPEISENSETEELKCEAESDRDASILWNINNANSTTSIIQKDNNYKVLRSSLKLTEEIRTKRIYCSVSTENESHNTKSAGTSHGGVKKSSFWSGKEIPKTETSKGQLSSKNLTISAFLILLAVALVAVAFWYLLKRRNRSIVGEAPEEQKTVTISVAGSCII